MAAARRRQLSQSEAAALSDHLDEASNLLEELAEAYDHHIGLGPRREKDLERSQNALDNAARYFHQLATK